jgi:peptidoglycan/LPS O-acetylase OafA/YrhL
VIKYRREIDGLRALAVLPVILFHAGFSAFSGGYAGVDVFFVISGYLITAIILAQSSEGGFSIARFYERRARRILPALFLVMLVSLPFAWYCLLPHQLRYFSQSLVATTLFLSNVFFYLKSNYFSEAAEITPLLHTWSLAVEEQFYLVFPLFLVAMGRLHERWLVRSLWALALASLALAQLGTSHAPAAAFFLLPTRGWELLIGALASVYAMRAAASDPRALRLPPAAMQGLSLCGLLLIGFAVFAYDAHTPFPGLPALAPTVGAVLILLFADSRTWAGRLLGTRAMVGVGLISYSAYLWHQPLFAFARAISEQDLSAWQSAALCVLVLPLSALSWYFVERPVRSSRRGGLVLLVAAALLAALFTVLGFIGHRTDGFIDYKVSQIAPQYRHYLIDKRVVVADRIALWDQKLAGSDRPFDAAQGQRRLLILGDSKAEDLYVAMDLKRELFPQLQLRRATLDDECMGLMTSTLQGIKPSLADRLHEMAAPSDKNCKTDMARLAANHLLEDADEVVLSTTWQDHTWQDGARFAIQIAKPARPVSVVSTANFNDLSSLSMRVAAKQLDPAAAGRFFFANIRPDWNKPGDELAATIKPVAHTRYLEKLALFCDLPNKTCPMFSPTGEPYVYDGGHVTIRGAQDLGQRVHEAGWFAK